MARHAHQGDVGVRHEDVEVGQEDVHGWSGAKAAEVVDNTR
jgi:hypothetical protein